ncbi:MAG: hydrogenase formation protein HypD [Chloroflexi bacterium]|nr:hydrogenase formation protein HypD [Chloroflexota bacterium]MBI4316249.1 hydrogenase formation protein HypD [Chloroflexota bacterium]
MKYIDEYRDEALTRNLLDEIRRTVTRHWTMMEVCGGQTHSILRSGLDQLLPPEIELVHGPGCPVCVTPLELIDKAIALASRPDVIFVSYGDMLRVPGSERDLFSVRAAGGNVRVVYSPLDSLKIARENPDKTVVFFGIGFETTAPANAMAVVQAKAQGISNFAMLVSHVTVPPAICALMESPDVRVDAFLAAGHVCTVMGYWEYEPLAKKYNVPVVVMAFEPVDIARAILMCVRQLEEGRAEVENAYARSVRREGNVAAQRVINEVFEPCDRPWRGIGVIPQSGYKFREAYAAFDAELRFPEVQTIATKESSLCLSGLVLQGLRKPNQCPAFGKECTPQTPLGATMVSSEGACAAYYRYGRYAELQTSNSQPQTLRSRETAAG